MAMDQVKVGAVSESNFHLDVREVLLLLGSYRMLLKTLVLFHTRVFFSVKCFFDKNVFWAISSRQNGTLLDLFWSSLDTRHILGILLTILK